MLIFISRALVVPLIVSLVLRGRLVVTADAAHWVECAAEHETDSTDMAAAKTAIADSADKTRPEPVGTDRQEDKVGTHDDSPRSVVRPDEGPTCTHFPAFTIRSTAVDLLLHDRLEIPSDLVSFILSIFAASYIELAGVVQTEVIESRHTTAVVYLLDCDVN